MHLLIWMESLQKILSFGTTYVVIPALLTNSVMLMYWMEDPTQISLFLMVDELWKGLNLSSLKNKVNLKFSQDN